MKLKKTIPFWISLIVSVGLFVAGFCVPPMGEIDGSVLKAAGILFGFAVLAQIPAMIQTAEYAKFTHGDTIIEVDTKHDNK